MVYTVKQLSKLAGVSVRTLHYYDEIGLLKPSFVKENGYRCYESKELLKLQQILFFKELDFSLEDIVRIISAPDFDMVTALNQHKKMLEMKKQRIEALLQTTEKTIKNLKGGAKMTNDDLFDSFDEKQFQEYQEEAKRRWGNTDAYRQSMERTKNWTSEDYKNIAKQGKIFTQKLADNMDAGFDSPKFQALIEEHYKSVQYFYDCPLDFYRTLGNMYVEDKRFAAYYEQFKPGLADFMRKAINYYCDNKELSGK